jgi:chemotaxis response regulator CheB
MERARIVVVDDSVTMRAMIQTLLERDGKVSVVGIARDAEEAMELIARTDPDVVTLDIAMPGRDGMAILDDIMWSTPRPVIMLSTLMRDGAPLAAKAVERGAAGCFNKAAIVREAKRLIDMIGAAAAHRGDYEREEALAA